jgi:hypothetical protein
MGTRVLPEEWGYTLSRTRRSIAASLMPSLLTLLLVTACGGGKATATIVSPTPATSAPTATTITPLLLTPRASVTNGATSPSGSVGAASAGMVYTDPQGRFSFNVPEGYQQTPIPPQQQGMVVARFASAGIDALLIVQTQNMEPNATLDLKTAAAQNTASKFPGSQVLTSVPLETIVAGQAARQYEWLVPLNGTQYHVLSVNTVRGGQFYTINIQIAAQNYAANIGQAKTFINTFAFLGSG